MAEPTTDALTIIEEEARLVARSFGIAVESELAAALADRVANRLAGQELYFSKAKFKRAREHAAMRAQFKGDNLAEVARIFGKSTRQARRIVMPRTPTKK